MDIKDRSVRPTLEEMGAYVRNPLFLTFCSEMTRAHGCREAVEFSACSMEPGWNVKFRRAGRTLCTLYPREGFFTVMVVVGRREKEAVEAALPDFTPALRRIYEETKEGNGQRWLMVDLEDEGALYRDVLRLAAIRRAAR